jgi:hypothetical protein
MENRVEQLRVKGPTVQASFGIDRRIYVAAAVLSLLLSAWAVWAQFVPNPDAALYLRSAEQFAHGQWTAGIGTFRWPFYSLLIAATMTITGLKALVAAEIVNACLAAITVVAFVALVTKLSNGDRLTALCAAFIILLQPHLAGDRPSVIRDNGYLAFFVVTLYLVARDQLAPSLKTRLAIAASIVISGLFRIEGFALAALVPFYYLLRQPGVWKRPSLLIGIVVACLALVPAALLWTSGDLTFWLQGHFESAAIARQWIAFSNTIATRLHQLKDDFLYPYGGGNEWGAYIGLVIGIVIVNIVRSLTVPLAILTVFVFVPKPVMPRPASGFVLWFALGQLPMLFVLAFVMLFLDKRYAVGMVLVIDIALAFLMAEAIRQWRSDWLARIFAPIAAATLIGVFAFAVPKPSKLEYLKEAGQWIGEALPERATIATNDARIAYFSGRPYDQIHIWTFSQKNPPTDAELATFDYFAFDVASPGELPLKLVNLSAKELVRSFTGRDGHTVLIYRQTRPAAATGG